MSAHSSQQPAGGRPGEQDNESSGIIAIDIQAQENVKQYIIRGIINEEFVPTFFASIQKVPARIGYAIAAVTMTENGIRLIYDTAYFAEATKEQIDFVLSHELMHVLSYHFLRGEEMMVEYNIGLKEFYKQYAPYADLPVNYSLKDLPGFLLLKDMLLTYEKTEVEYETHPTFESIVRYLLQNPGEEEKSPTVINVNEDGSIEVITGDGNEAPVVVIPQVTSEGKRECTKDVIAIIKSSARMAGNAPYEIQTAIDSFLDEWNNQVLKGWALLEHMLIGERAINKGMIRSYARLNRRTRRLPGKKKVRGFSALFIVDESGSMSDEEIQLAFALIKKVVLRENNDKVYVVHWDTEPVGTVDQLQYASDMANLMRKKSGGTNFSDFFSHAIFHAHDYDLYICVTDGYPGTWPRVAADKPVVWIITQEGGYTEWKNRYNKGLAVCVQE